MQPYRQFIFESYDFDRASGLLTLRYSLDGVVPFTETFRFAFDFASDYSEAALDRAIQTLFFLAGVSYYKTYVPPEIIVKAGQIDAASAAFYGKTYQRGLGEFFYVNKLDPTTPVIFPVTTDTPLAPAEHSGDGALVSIGGGKDSLVSIELLRPHISKMVTWSLGHEKLLAPLVDRINLPHATVERSWDPSLIELNKQGAYNGHVPISSLFASVGVIVAILQGLRDVVVANEQSANEPTLVYKGVSINHQYSKSQEFERDLQAHLAHTFKGNVRYYSFLRPLSEIFICEIFARAAFDKYKDVFSSCNRAFVHTSTELTWCGTCPKCAFIFIALTPFIPRVELEALWGGKNLLLDPALEPTYKQLLGIEGNKPLECVGEIKESRAAMRLAEAQYPELADKYHYELPADYDYRLLASDEMPTDIKGIFKDSLHEVR